MSNAIDDKELNEYLGGNTEFSQRYHTIETNDVPVEMDRLVLAKANESSIDGPAGARIQNTKSRPANKLQFWIRASIPVALAASFVLVVSIVIRSGVSDNSELLSSKELESKQESAGSDSAVETFSQPARQEASDTVTLPEKRAEIAVTARKRIETIQDAPSSATAAPSGPPAIASPVELSKSAPTRALAAQESAEAAKNIAPTANVEKTAAATYVSETVQAAPRSQTEDRAEKAALSGAEPRRAVATPNANSYDKTLQKQQREANPAAWLEYIRQLRATGESRTADDEWRRFVKAYPNYTVDATDLARGKK